MSIRYRVSDHDPTGCYHLHRAELTRSFDPIGSAARATSLPAPMTGIGTPTVGYHGEDPTAYPGPHQRRRDARDRLDGRGHEGVLTVRDGHDEPALRAPGAGPGEPWSRRCDPGRPRSRTATPGSRSPRSVPGTPPSGRSRPRGSSASSPCRRRWRLRGDADPRREPASVATQPVPRPRPSPSDSSPGRGRIRAGCSSGRWRATVGRCPVT